MGQLFLMRNTSIKFQNPTLNFEKTLGRTHAQTSIKQYAPFNFSKIWAAVCEARVNHSRRKCIWASPLDNILEALSLCEGDMTICLPSAGNIAL